MEINYDMIIKCLSPNKTDTYHFESQKNIMCFSDKFPSEFRELLGDKFYRTGVTQEMGEQKISFFTSLLTLLVDNYVTLIENEEITEINKLIADLCEYINKTIPKSLEDIAKSALRKYIKEKDACIWTLEILVNRFGINILIFDFKSKEIYTVYPSEFMNPWKPFLLFGKFENKWEPIRTNEKNNFSYNDNIIRKILSNSQTEIKYYDGNLIKKDYILMDNINEIINIEFKENIKTIQEDSNSNEEDNSYKKDEDTENSINDAFIKTDKISKGKLEKMKKDDIINYMKSLNINVKINSKTTKKQLLDMIC